MFTAETIEVDDRTCLILAKEQLVFARVHSITDGATGQELLPANAKSEDDDILPAFTEAAKPRYKGVRYDKIEGKITGYVLHNSSPLTAKPVEAITIPREPDARALELMQLGFPVPAQNQAFHIEHCPEMPIPAFEQAYHHFAHAHRREGEDPGAVLVRPCVVRQVRELDKQRLVQRHGGSPASTPGEGGGALHPR